MPNGHSSDTIYELNLEIAQLKTKEIARKLLASGILSEPEQYTLQQLFRVRDCLLMLKAINPLFCDEGLLEEVLLYLKDKEDVDNSK